jgi:hypothetical protein
MFDTSTRNKLATFVGKARKLLCGDYNKPGGEITSLLQTFGIQPDGSIADLEGVPGLDQTGYELGQALRDNLAHKHAQGPAKKTWGKYDAAVYDLLQEQSFTVLNRLCALRMVEERGLIIPCISKGMGSDGFELYEEITDKSHFDRDTRYQHFIFSLFDELAIDLGILFDRFSPHSLLFPRPEALSALLDLFNDRELAPLWAQDETIGWVYQHWNSKEERKAMRDASDSPRNTREIAVRNQFFTPRYVVEFLTDNTLGRIWYEMCQGRTRLKDQCRYLVRGPNEVFLAEGDSAPGGPSDRSSVISEENLSQENLLKQPVYIPHRPIKDPREIRLLDPACGSMHFGLYAFDLFETIYEEAWELAQQENVPSLGFSNVERSLITEQYSSKAEYMLDVPRMIIEHNIHGVDIDPRAVQIAGLSLWLRAQKAWKEITTADRPRVRRSNIVCAEPMPGSKEMLEEFVATLDPPLLGELVKSVFSKMELAGEAGPLLKIEEEIRMAIEEGRTAWEKLGRISPELFSTEALKQTLKPGAPQELSGVEKSLLADQRPLGSDFFETAEDRIYAALQNYAQSADALGYRRRLFAEDAAHGFAFIDLCRIRYDAVVMNPPFGEASEDVLEYLLSHYVAFNRNLLCAFIARSGEMGNKSALVGAIYDRTALIKSTYEEFRLTHMIEGDRLIAQCDLGWEVLDANVEATSSVLRVNPIPSVALFIDVRSETSDKKGEKSLKIISDLTKGEIHQQAQLAQGTSFRKFPNAVIGYDFPEYARRSFKTMRGLSGNDVVLYEGHTLKSEVFFRYWWEVPLSFAFIPGAKWQRLYNGGDYQRYISPLCDATLYGSHGSLVSQHPSTVLRNLPLQQKGKVGFGKRGEYIDAHVVPPGFVSTVEGKHVNIDIMSNPFAVLALLNSEIFQAIINLYCGQHKYPGYVGIFPSPDIRSDTSLQEAATICEKICHTLKSFECLDESSPSFRGDVRKSIAFMNLLQEVEMAKVQISIFERELNNAIAKSYHLTKSEQAAVLERCNNAPSIGGWTENVNPERLVASNISYLLGSVFGRWDIRCATGEVNPPELSDPFEPLPVCPPGMLQNAEGLPAEPRDVPSDYPLRISWPGILVDDESHTEDIVARVTDALKVISPDNWEAIGREACEVLGVKDLRQYFTEGKSGGKFFADHLSRYSKSRRQAPIYWPLATTSGSYTLWLCYHRLSNDTLYAAVSQFVEPRIEDAKRNLARLQDKGDARSKQEDKTFEQTPQFIGELATFREELLRIAGFWKPNLNDGVLITAAPLWTLFRMKPWQGKIQEAWQQLEKGDSDWASLAHSIWPKRVISKCAKDRSLAISHGYDHLFWEEITGKKGKTTWQPKKDAPKLVEQAIDELLMSTNRVNL